MLSVAKTDKKRLLRSPLPCLRPQRCNRLATSSILPCLTHLKRSVPGANANAAPQGGRGQRWIVLEMGGGASTRRAPVLDNPPPRSLSPSPLLGHVHTSPLPGLGDSIGTSAPPNAPPPAGESADGNIEQAAPPPAPAYSARVLAAIDAIAAVVEFNRISLQESYEAFDTDEDDKLSFSDLQTAVQTLGLEISSDAVYDLYTALDPAGLGYIRSDLW